MSDDGLLVDDLSAMMQLRPCNAVVARMGELCDQNVLFF
eukprot:CAMPEP_0202712054 /NCGR_PEP_ID=MMETSP1385-20130828/32133_1 /ASSEMBLY_ACC=CAM_ASM_000861 /TAXON_ID=933848 /ORGANISM="Elphidium margaritaceum" /LENGTH=38 /DNA_ID= /DNA_START= /DNA_END= /DNA_ORIENTATION=